MKILHTLYCDKLIYLRKQALFDIRRPCYVSSKSLVDLEKCEYATHGPAWKLFHSWHPNKGLGSSWSFCSIATERLRRCATKLNKSDHRFTLTLHLTLTWLFLLSLWCIYVCQNQLKDRCVWSKYSTSVWVRLVCGQWRHKRVMSLGKNNRKQPVIVWFRLLLFSWFSFCNMRMDGRCGH